MLKERSVDERQVNALGMAKHTRMTTLIEHLQHDVLLNSLEEDRNIRIKAPSYILINGELYRKGFTMPWLKCVDEARGREALQEAHIGKAGVHEGAFDWEGALHGKLPAHHTSRCGGINKKMCGMPSVFSGPRKSSGPPKEYI